jgi:hypothetical protein
MSTAQDFANDMRPPCDPLANHEERRTRSMLIQQIEDPRSVFDVGTIIDC